MTRFRRIVGIGLMTVLSVGALFLVACGGGGGGDDGGIDTSGVQIDPGKSTPGAAVPEQVIEVKDNSFSPDTVTIKAGTKVVWKWTGTANPHSVQLSGQTSTQQTSGSFERVFSQSGNTFSYQCGVHGTAMAGKIVIE